MIENNNAAPSVAADESGKGDKTFSGHFTPGSDTTISEKQKQQERAERLLFILARAVLQNGGRDTFISFPTLSCISLIPEDEVKGLWYPYLPLGEFTVLMADGGTGKGILCCGIAAAITRGKKLPGDENQRSPGTVLQFMGNPSVSASMTVGLNGMVSQRLLSSHLRRQLAIARALANRLHRHTPKTMQIGG